MNNYTNPYVRLQTYYSWLSSRCSEGLYTGMPICELQAATQIPVSVIRADLSEILKWNADIIAKYQAIPELEDAAQMIENMICFDIDASSSPFPKEQRTRKNKAYSALEDLLLDLESGVYSPELDEKLLSGELDQIPLFISHSCYTEFDLALTYDETLALEAIRKDLSSEESRKRQNSHFFQIKDSYRTIHNYRELTERLQFVEEAIEEQQPLCIKYKNARNEISQFSFQPLKISYDETENLYCILSTYQGQIQVYRLDRILGLWPGQEEVETGNVSLIQELAPQVWGNCFLEKPEQVKVKFYNEANVWEKVKRDLACRTKGQLYEKDGFLYYEDTVYGISKFRPWIYGFGSSAIVLEPQSLREHIIASLKERKDRDQF